MHDLQMFVRISELPLRPCGRGVVGTCEEGPKGIRTRRTRCRCMECGEYLEDVGALEMHRKVKHGSNTTLMCSECGRGFCWDRDLRRHERLHAMRREEEEEEVEEEVSMELKDNPCVDHFGARLRLDFLREMIQADKRDEEDDEEDGFRSGSYGHHLRIGPYSVDVAVEKEEARKTDLMKNAMRKLIVEKKNAMEELIVDFADNLVANQRPDRGCISELSLDSGIRTKEDFLERMSDRVGTLMRAVTVNHVGYAHPRER